MTARTPIVLVNSTHTPLPGGDSLPASLLQLSSDSGNKLSIGSDGGLMAQMDAPSLPTLTIELGHSSQENNGRGIDRGTFYQLDFKYGVNTKNNFNYTLNDDGTIYVPSGVYLVLGSFKVMPYTSDTFDLPAQMIVATGMRYDFPGIYQYAVQSYPMPKFSSVTTSNSLGSISMSGAMPMWTNDQKLWLGFSKVAGSAGQYPLLIQGFLNYLKVG